MLLWFLTHMIWLHDLYGIDGYILFIMVSLFIFLFILKFGFTFWFWINWY